MTEQLPVPLLPATVDLRVFRSMPLDVVRLRDAETSVVTEGDEFRCAVLLWCAAWHQVPAASLPDDDRILADLAGFGRVVKEWKKVRDGSLRGFVKCSDGRLYHRVVSEVAISSWGALLQQRWRTECNAIKKRQQRAKQTVALPPFSLWITANCPEASPYVSQWTKRSVSEDIHPSDTGHTPHVPREKGSNGIEGIVDINQHSQDSSSSDSENAGTTPRPEGRNSNPPRVPSDTPWQAKLRADGWRKGLEPGLNESWEAFKSRVQGARAAA